MSLDIGCSKPFSEKLSYVEGRRKYTYRLGGQVVREVLNGDIINVAARYDLKESEVPTNAVRYGQAEN